MDLNFPKLEKKILKFWRENKIFEKSIEQRKKSPNFVFYEGPPTVNAKPGIHHLLARIFKDIICRYKTMAGFKVERKAGWDTHGLPVELEIEKRLGFKNKKEIENYGIAKFNKKCKQSVWNYKKDFEKITERSGYWLDLKNPYITYTPEYIESLWWILKEIWKKGLLYRDFKVVPYCPRCQTTLSLHEVAQGYKTIKEKAIYLKFKILNPEFKNTFLLVWTTTPWTLPGNVAIAVNPNFDYLFLEKEGEVLILAKERAKALNIEGKILKEVKGKDLIGLKYQPVFDFYQPDFEKERIWEVLGADFVLLEEGTGLVHIAPAFGEEDMELIKTQNSKLKTQNQPEFPIILNVDEDGKFKLEVKKFAGLFVKEADSLIIQDLKERGILFKEELYEHDYPFCWRCDTPLLYYAKQSWFIKIQKIKKDLIKNNQKINWVPAHLKEGRFGEWLKEIKDWALSRERYWGTPLPVWQCKNCKRVEMIGSLKDLLSQNFSTNRYFIFRHGHSLRQVKKISMSWPEKIYCPLTKKGEKKVKKSAKKLEKEKIDLIFSSDLLRAKQTAEILAKELKIKKIIFDKRLREYNVGIFNGRDSRLVWDYLRKTKDKIKDKIPEGESFVDMAKRMFKFLESLNKKYQNKNILIVSHELPLTILEQTLKGVPLREIIEKREEKKIDVIKTGDFREIEFKKLPFNENMELDFHRPYVDEVKFYCKSCSGILERVPEVIDCWFDSGSMPFAQYHWPFEKKLLFPADYIAEGIDQTRGWFYTLLAISTLLGKGLAYKNVIALGLVLDEKGEKMSKSKGNVVDPFLILEKYGADALRWYFYTINQPAEAKLFSEKDVENSLRRFLLTFWNCFVFFQTYALLDKHLKINSKNILDKWIISRVENLVKEVTQKLNNYDVTGAAREIENFVVNDLSLWYIRRSRRRFQKPDTEKELKEASNTLGFVLLILSKLSAPFVPFLSEKIYQGLKFENFESVHLADWPKFEKKLVDKKLEEKMKKAREIVALALAERAKFKIKVRQPLWELRIPNTELKKEKEILEIIKEEINVKEITFGKTLKLDTELTPALREEGIIRELIRQIQDLRKKANLKPKDKISIEYLGEEITKILEKNKKLILEEAKIKDFVPKGEGKGNLLIEKEIEINDQKVWLGIKK
jgi:isoleucyl-tRNA synthetase